MSPIFDNPDHNSPPQTDSAQISALQAEHHELTKLASIDNTTQGQVTTVRPPTVKDVLVDNAVTRTTGAFGESQGIKEFKLSGNWSSIGPFPSDNGIIHDTYELHGFTHGSNLVYVTYNYIMWGASPTASEKKAVLDIMSKPDHKLTDAEILNIRPGGPRDPGGGFLKDPSIPALSDTNEWNPDDFSIQSAWTKTIHGSRMLFIEGKYLKGNDKGVHELTAYMDSDPGRQGRLPESLSFVASNAGSYTKYRPVFMQAIESIRKRQPAHANEQRKSG